MMAKGKRSVLSSLLPSQMLLGTVTLQHIDRAMVCASSSKEAAQSRHPPVTQQR